MFLACCHFDNLFGTHGHIPNIYKFIDQILLDFRSIKAPRISGYISNILKLNWKLILHCGKVRKIYFTSAKKANILYFFKRLKAV